MARNDEELIQLLEHDVQFYEEEEQSLEERWALEKASWIHLGPRVWLVAVQDVKEAYEKKLLEQETSFKAMLKSKDYDIQVLKGKVAGLEESVQHLKERKATDRVGELTQKLEAAERTIEEIDSELQFAQDENRRWRSEHNGLLKQLEDAKGALQEKVQQCSEQSVELGVATDELARLKEELQLLRSELASTKAGLAAERARVEEQQKRWELSEMKAERARRERAERLVKQQPKELAQSVASDDRQELAELHAQDLERAAQQLEALAAARAEVEGKLRAAEVREREAEGRARALEEELRARDRLEKERLKQEKLRLEQLESREAALEEKAVAHEAAKQEQREKEAALAALCHLGEPTESLEVERMHQSQQTDGEAADEPEAVPLSDCQALRTEVEMLRVREVELLKTIAALQEELRAFMSHAPRPSEDDVEGPWELRGAGLRIESYHGHREDLARSFEVNSDVSKLLDYPRVMTMGGCWLHGVCKMHEQLPFQSPVPASKEVWPPRGRSPHLEDQPAELTARWPSPPQQCSSPLLLAKAKRSTVCRSPPRFHAEVPEEPPAPASPPRREPSEASTVRGKRHGHPLGHPMLGTTRVRALPTDESSWGVASIDMAAAAEMHQRPVSAVLPSRRRRPSAA